jgi:hypothetical protein
MTIYVPIFKSKPAEIWACQHASSNFLTKNRVVFEIVPGEDPDKTVTTFATRLSKAWPTGAVVTVDSRYVGRPHGMVYNIAQALDRHYIKECPVFHLDDSPLVLGEVRKSCALHAQGACLRLGSEDNDPDPTVSQTKVMTVLNAVGLMVSDIDLLIDFSVIDSIRDVTRCVPLAINMLSWAKKLGKWRSVTISSGAFPLSISNLGLGQATSLHRYDALFFTTVTQANLPIQPDYGDYGINYPRMPIPVPRGPKPNLRYTDGKVWQVYREDKILPGNESFYTLCSRVVNSAHWAGQNYSSGDVEIERCSRSTGGAGTATQWLAYGTSHHLVHVDHRLARLGVP